MSKFVLPDAFYTAFQELDGIVVEANNRKIRLLLDALGIPLHDVDFTKFWNGSLYL